MAMTLCPARVLTPSRPAPLAQQPFGVLSGMLQSKGRAGAMDASKQACADSNASIKSDGEHHTTGHKENGGTLGFEDAASRRTTNMGRSVEFFLTRQDSHAANLVTGQIFGCPDVFVD